MSTVFPLPIRGYGLAYRQAKTLNVGKLHPPCMVFIDHKSVDIGRFPELHQGKIWIIHFREETNFANLGPLSAMGSGTSSFLIKRPDFETAANATRECPTNHWLLEDYFAFGMAKFQDL